MTVSDCLTLHDWHEAAGAEPPGEWVGRKTGSSTRRWEVSIAYKGPCVLPWLWEDVVAGGEVILRPQPIPFRAGPEGSSAPSVSPLLALIRSHQGLTGMRSVRGDLGRVPATPLSRVLGRLHGRQRGARGHVPHPQQPEPAEHWPQHPAPDPPDPGTTIRLIHFLPSI